MASSPGPITAWIAEKMASVAPSVTVTSLSGSTLMP